MKKKFLLLIALGLAASVQAQNAPVAPANAAAAPAPQPAPAAAPAAEPAPAAVPVAEPAPAAPATDSVATAEPAPANAAADSTAAAPEQVAETDSATAAPVADSVAVAEPAPANAAADSTVTVADSTVADSAAAAPEQVAMADSAKAAIDSLANDTSKVAQAPVNKLGDILHGNAYNTVGNEAAAATIGGNIGFPHFMYGSKLAYFDPLAQQGAVAFGDSWTYFLSFDNNTDMGLLTAGIAFQNFGVSLDYSMGKSWRYIDHSDGSKETEKRTNPNSMVGGNASVHFGSFDVLLSGHYAVPDSSLFLSKADSEEEDDIWAASGYLGISYSGDVFYWTLGVEGLRNENKHKSSKSELQVIGAKNYIITTKTTKSDTLAHIMINPSFSVGAAVLSSEKANVYLGLNTSVPMYRYDDIDSVYDKHNEGKVILTPNILGEVQLSKYFMAFGGASYEWTAAEYTDRKLKKKETETIATNMDGTNVNIGARLDYGCTAVEVAFSKTFLKNPFSGYGDSKVGVVSSLGAFIYF